MKEKQQRSPFLALDEGPIYGETNRLLYCLIIRGFTIFFVCSLSSRPIIVGMFFNSGDREW